MVWSNKLLLASTSLIVPGDPDPANGGYRAYNNFGDGLLYNLNIAPKSTEVSRTWGNSGTTLLGALSWLNGPANTNLATAGTTANSAQLYAKSVSLGGSPCYLGALNELRSIYYGLKPASATSPLFQSGGSEEFTSGNTWSSTEDTATSAGAVGSLGGYSFPTKSTSYFIRPIRRIAIPMPFPIGTAMEGGYLAGYFTDAAPDSPLTTAPATYMLIVADKATQVTRAYQTSTSSLGGIYLSRTNGSAPTEANGAATNQAAMNYCFDLVSGTKTDWYLPAVDELNTIARMDTSLPSGQRMDLDAGYSSSTEISATTSKIVTLNTGGTITESSLSKTATFRVRPVRRVLLPAT